MSHRTMILYIIYSIYITVRRENWVVNGNFSGEIIYGASPEMKAIQTCSISALIVIHYRALRKIMYNKF